ncbi:MAG TPA: glycosyltransferase family 2 protein [Gemmataceae bacterium]|nr:glycosyltransferase family 2 protein [Gemmataceae bacterium]
MSDRASVVHPPQPATIRRPVGINPAARLPQLSIVIVNYRQWDNTAALVRQILGTAAARRGAVEVVVVDNHSPPHPLAARLRRWPGVSLRRWGRNRGFARAVNEGCRLSRGQWFLLLNPDMTLADGFVDGVLRLADQLGDADPKTGIVGFRLLNNDGTTQLSSGQFPTLASSLAGLMRPRQRRKYQSVNASHRSQVNWVTGCCLLMRRGCVQELRGLDQSMFLYYEDVDLCRRAQEKGWKVWYEPTLRAVHHDPSHGRPVSPQLRLIARHSLLTYASRHWPRWQYGLLAGIVRLEACVRRWWAKQQGHDAPASVYGQLELLAGELWQGAVAAGRRRLIGVVKSMPPAAGGQR